MNKISLAIDVNKIDKNRLELVSYKTKAGNTVTEKQLKVDVIPLKEPTTISSGDTWELVKVGFVCETPTKSEREAKTKTTIVGSATQFKDKNAQPNFDKDSKGNDIDIEIPF